VTPSQDNPPGINIGTSGWHYSHWSGSFYPASLSSEEYLDYYCQQFKTVEINNTFYQFPEKDTLENWRQIVPSGFVFSVKASRYLTHMKKLTDPEEPLETFLERVSVLADRLGPILFQLPPHWRPNLERLEQFLALLPQEHQYAFEFRDERWLTQAMYDLLRRYQAALCIYHLEGYLSPREVTSDMVYIRLHGPGEAYQGSYNTQDLAGWAVAISTWHRQGKQIYCYFDNDAEAAAPANATQLSEMLVGKS
jgi:uncharacterized protein YecE (DUF72 family)